jgi:hypothetical protein
MWLVSVVILAVACAALITRRALSRRRTTVPHLRAAPPRLLCIVIPQGQDGCEAALGLTTHRFDRRGAPKLPLAECTMSESCRCRYQAVAERRLTIRRKGTDRRARIRFDPENPPRRWGPGRRKKDLLGWSGVKWYALNWSRSKTDRPSAHPAAPAKIAVKHDPHLGKAARDLKDQD